MYTDFLHNKFNTVYDTWKLNRFDDEIETISVNRYTSENDIDPELKVESEVGDIIRADHAHSFNELATVNQIKIHSKNEFISGLQWNNKHHKEIILRERRKRRNMYFKEAIEKQALQKQQSKAKIEFRRKKRVDQLEKELAAAGIDEKKLEMIQRKMVKESEKKTKRIQKIK